MTGRDVMSATKTLAERMFTAEFGHTGLSAPSTRCAHCGALIFKWQDEWVTDVDSAGDCCSADGSRGYHSPIEESS